MKHAEGWAEGPPVTSENQILELVDQAFPPVPSGHVLHGRGHDCAELDVHCPLALSTDFFWQHSHFNTAYFTPEDAGAKALAVTVSDLSAAGAAHLGFSLGLMLPPHMGQGTIARILSGMARVASLTGIALSGGDLSKGPALGFCLTAWGQSIEPEKGLFLRRDPVAPGNVLFMAGRAGSCAGAARAGMAFAGRLIMEEYGREAAKDWPEICQAHLTPDPTHQEGLALARLKSRGARLSLMDVSDGLMSDLPRLLKTCGAELSFSRDIIHPEVLRFAKEHGFEPESVFLKGGEEYSLLGACAASDWPALCAALPHAVMLGTVCERPGVRLHGKELEMKGFDHFGM